jgi:sialidase-1
MAVITLPRTLATDRKDALPLSTELHTRCLDILRTGLHSEEFWPAMHAAEALTLAGAGDEVVLALRDRVSKEKDDQHRCGLARELARAGDKRQLETLFQVLADLHSTGRTHAAESLYKVGEIGDGELLRAAMNQTDSIPLQVMAAGALAKSGEQKAFLLLRANLLSKDQTTRNLSAWILGRLGDESDIPPLVAAISNEQDEMSRTFLAAALACLGNDKGREALGQQLSSENVTARTMAAEFVGHSRSIEFRDKLIKLLDDPALDVRVRAAQSLIALSMPVSGP